MQSFITFFRNQEQDHGRTYRLTITKGEERLLLEIYAARPMKSSVLREDQAYKSDKDYDLFFEDLKRAIKEAGGCLAVTRNAAKGGRIIVVDVVSGPGYKPPKSAVKLDPVYPPKRVDFKGAVIELTPGAHLILPAHGEAEQQLMSFLGNLTWLSGDMQALVLNGMRRPSLDSRVERLEAAVNPEKSGAPGVREKGLRGALVWAKDLASKPAPRGPVIAFAILMMLIVNAVLLRTVIDLASRGESTIAQKSGQPNGGGGNDSDNGNGGAGGDSTNGGSSGDENGNTNGGSSNNPGTDSEGSNSGNGSGGSGGAEGPFSSTISSFYNKLRGRGDNEPLKKLYDKQFRDYSGTDWTEVAAKAALGNKAFAWGLIKVQGLKIASAKSGVISGFEDAFFESPTRAVTATNKFFSKLREEESTKGPLAADQAGLRMVAVLVCEMNYKESGLGVLPKGSTESAFVVLEDVRCEDLQMNDVLAGINGLAGFVETTSIRFP